MADRLLVALKDAGATGLDYSAQSQLFSRHAKAARLRSAREVLEKRGLTYERQIQTAGKPRTVTYYAGAKEAKEANKALNGGS